MCEPSLQSFEGREAGQGGDGLQVGLLLFFLLIGVADLSDYRKPDDAGNDGQDDSDEDAEVDDEAVGCRERLVGLWADWPGNLEALRGGVDGGRSILGCPGRQKILNDFG